MKNDKLLEQVVDYIEIVNDNPELFHDGIDKEISSLLMKVHEYMIKQKIKQDKFDNFMNKNVINYANFRKELIDIFK